MVFALPENAGGARRGARSPDPVLSPALGESLCAMAGEHSGLVHQPPDLVGTSHTGVVPEIPSSKSQIPKRREHLRRRRDAAGSGELAAGSRHARYLVLVL